MTQAIEKTLVLTEEKVSNADWTMHDNYTDGNVPMFRGDGQCLYQSIVAEIDGEQIEITYTEDCGYECDTEIDGMEASEVAQLVSETFDLDISDLDELYERWQDEMIEQYESDYSDAVSDWVETVVSESGAKVVSDELLMKFCANYYYNYVEDEIDLEDCADDVYDGEANGEEGFAELVETDGWKQEHTVETVIERAKEFGAVEA